MQKQEFASAAEAVRWIHGEDGSRTKGEKHGLDNMRALLAALGDPQASLRMLHVAGTNGKGSTCAFLESALRACGLKTGLYTSPYLCRYNERIRVNGLSVSDGQLIRLASRVRQAVDALAGDGILCTTFEIGTAMAFLCFAEERVDAAVIEVGLGGRLDPTNVITPAVSVIAAIGLDHMATLGDTVGQVAGEKAGILKPGVPAAVYPLEEEALAPVLAKSAEVGAPLRLAADIPLRDVSVWARGASFSGAFPSFGDLDVRIRLVGRHQVQNARLAICALSLLRERGWPLSSEDVCRGMEEARWPGRLEWLDGSTLIDGAHNAQGAEALAGYVREYLGDRRCVLVTGMMKDKQISACAALLAPVFDAVVATRVDYPRAATGEELRQVYAGLGVPCGTRADIPSALAAARSLAGDKGVVVAAGSLYVAGEARMLLTGGEVL